MSEGSIIEGVSSQGDVSITTGVGQVTGTNFSDGWTKEIQISSATDSSFTFRMSNSTGNCDDELDELGPVRTGRRVDSRPRYNQ